jgi:4'-phosphopantetheinyl transferase
MLLFDEATELRSPVWGDSFPAYNTLEGNVHIFRVNLDANSIHSERFTRFLSCDEVDRARRFHFDRDRIRYSIARGLLRVLIGRYFRCHPASISFCYNSFGKPYLRDPLANLSFNLSHSQEMALYAFAPRGELGVDIAWRDPKLRGHEIARRFFTPNESHLIEQASLQGNHEIFFYLWSRKEAYIKALSKGLSVPLNEFDIATCSSVDGFEIRSFIPCSDFSAALAVHPRPLEILFYDADQIDVVKDL